MIFSDYAPKPILKALIVKLEGPFDANGVIEKKPIEGFNYIFKAYTNVIPENSYFIPPLSIKWAKRTTGEIKEINNHFSLQNSIFDNSTRQYIYTMRIPYEHMILYAYIDSPSDKVRLDLDPKKKPFYYKGTKNWGQLQAVDDTISQTLKQGYAAYSKQDKAGGLGAATIDFYKKKTEQDLREIYEGKNNVGTRDVLSKETANIVVNHFYNGGGKKLSFDENSKLSDDLKINPTFQQYFANYLKVIKIILEYRDFNIKTINKNQIIEIFKKYGLGLFKPDFSKIKEMFEFEFYGLMGGTQTIKIELEIKEISINRYEISTTMYIGDWYGSDWDDIYQGEKSYDEIYAEISQSYSWLGKVFLADEIAKAAHAKVQLQRKGRLKGNIPSLNAFFMLQYYYGALPGYDTKYKPFESEIIYKSKDIISAKMNSK